MKEGKVFLLVVVMCSASVLTAAADETQPNSIKPLVEAQFDEVYNSNVSASSATIAAMRGLSLADAIYSPSLDLNYASQIGIFSYSLEGKAGYDFHQYDTILNRERIEALSSFGAQFDDCQATLPGSYTRHQSDLQDLIAVGTTNDTNEVITGGLSGTCSQLGRLVPSLSVAQNWSNHSALLLATSDYRSLTTQGSVMYPNPSLGEISLIGQYIETVYPHRIFAVGTGIQADGNKVYVGGVQIKHDFGSRFSLLLLVSETSLRSDNGIGTNFDGITYDTTLTYQPTSRLTADVELSRKTIPSNLLNATYSVDEAYKAEIDYQLSGRLILKLGASDTHKVLEGAALVAGVDLTRQTVNSFFGSLGFDFTPTFSVTMTVNQDQRNADVVGYSYTGERVGLSISKAF